MGNRQKLMRNGFIMPLAAAIVWLFFYDLVFIQHNGVRIYLFLTSALIIGVLNQRVYNSKRISLKSVFIQSALFLLFFLIYAWSNDVSSSRNVPFEIIKGSLTWDSGPALNYFYSATFHDFIAYVIFILLTITVSLVDIDKLENTIKTDEIFCIKGHYSVVPILISIITYYLTYSVLATLEYRFHYSSLGSSELEFWSPPMNIIKSSLSTLKVIVLAGLQIGLLYFLTIKKKVALLKSLLWIFLIQYILVFLELVLSGGFDKYLPNYVMGMILGELVAIVTLLFLSNRINVCYSIPIAFLAMTFFTKSISILEFGTREVGRVFIYRWELTLAVVVSGCFAGLVYYLITKQINNAR